MSTSSLEKKLDALTAQVAQLAESQRRSDELWAEMTPILKQAMATATDKLAGLEARGYFDFGRALGHVAERVVEGYTADDVELLGNSIVAILDTVRAMTQPHVLKVVGELGDVVEGADDVKPVGVMGTIKAASRDEQVQRGMAVMLEVLRHVGRGAEQLDRRERLRRQLASRRAGPVTSVGATPRPRRAAHPTATPVAAKRAPVPEVMPVAGGALPGFPGVAFSEEGFLLDSSQWTRELAQAIAGRLGMSELSEQHWALIEFARGEYESTGASPNIRRLAKGSGIGTKDIYQMFPKAPGKCTAMIAGLPKPVGCI